MKNFKPGGFKKGGGAFVPRVSFADRKSGAGTFKRRDGKDQNSGDQKEFFSATCSTCGKSCEVPFRPSAGKPVYCKDCFANTDNRSGQSDKGYSDKRKDFSREKRREDAPRREFSPAKPDLATEDIKRQLAILESKLNRVLELINPPQPKVAKVSIDRVEADIPESEPAIPQKVRKPKTVKAVKKAAPKKKAPRKTSKK